MAETSWEALRCWETVRYLVYYLVEDLVAPERIQNKDVVDFSCGLGDLSLYMLGNQPKSLICTSPDDVSVPPHLKGRDDISFIPKLQASHISDHLESESCDLFVARMVFQFPTVEDHYIDVDGMLKQIYRVLRPGGRLIICSHKYQEFADHPSLWHLPQKELFEKVKQMNKGYQRERIEGLIELIETIGIPPREGVHGQTGFGLKALMCVDSFVKQGFYIEEASEIEDFTFPKGLQEALRVKEKLSFYEKISKQVFQIKKDIITSSEYQNKYSRPKLRQKLLKEILKLHSFETIPIFSICGVRP